MNKKFLNALEFSTYSFFLILLVCIQIKGANYTYVDTDNYFHVLRTIEFMQNPSPFEHLLKWTNYPFGEISHWTKLPDVIMSLLTLPFLPFYTLKTAAFLGGFLLNPLFLFLTFTVCWLTAKKTLNFRSRAALFIIFFAQTNFMQAFLANRPDHHSMLLFFDACALWQFTKFCETKKNKNLILLALCAASSLWITVEGVFLYASIAGYLYISSVLKKESFVQIFKFSAFYTLFITIFYIINPPYNGYLYFDNGRLSIFHVLLSAWICLSLYIAHFFKKQLIQFIFLCTSALFILLLSYYKGFLFSPFEDSIQTIFTDRVTEMAGGGNIYYLAYPIVALCCSVLLFQKKEYSPIYFYLLINLSIYIPLQIYAMRFTATAVFYAVFLIALYLTSLNLKNWKFCLLTFMLYSLNFLTFAIYTLSTNDILSITPKTPTLVNLEKDKFPEGSVVTDAFITPYIIWYAEKPTIASTYHRNMAGIIDNHKILFSTDKDEVIKLIRKHKVGSIYLPYDIDSKYYAEPEKNCDRLYGQIMKCGNYPDWLIKGKMPNAYFFTVDWTKLPL